MRPSWCLTAGTVHNSCVSSLQCLDINIYMQQYSIVLVPHISLPAFQPIVAQFKASQPFMAVCVCTLEAD